MNDKKEIRTRFAPSPSGFLHVGGARTALFNHLFARAKGGKCVLRVEDTDQERSSPESERIIHESLSWLGMEFDEGPDEGGPFGPYRQSERLDMYSTHTQRLLEKKLAYPCFCDNEELVEKQQRSKAMGLPHVYDGKCRGLSLAEVEDRKRSGLRPAIRFQVEPGEVAVDDLVQGRVKFDSRLIGDFIIVKSDGFPSYNYAVVIDDHSMKISHVIRGVGHLSNTPRQILIHEALGLPLPAHAHISEIVGTDRKKLSKRRGATSVLLFREMGYVPEAFVNYMALLGWYPSDGVEFMPDRGLEKKFDLDRCSKSPAMFDFFLQEKAGKDFDSSSISIEELRKIVNKKSKLNWLNNKHIRQTSLETIWDLAVPFLSKDTSVAERLKTDPEKVRRIFDTVRVYLDTLEEAVPYVSEILKDDVSPEDDEARKVLEAAEAPGVLATFGELLKTETPTEPEGFAKLMKETGARTGAKGRALFMTIRVGTTGSMRGLELPTLFALLGTETVLQRLRQGAQT